MTRPNIGTLPGASTLDEESYLDFVEGMRSFNLRNMIPRMMESADRLGVGMTGATAGDLWRTLETVPAAQLTKRMMRTTQQMMWRGAGATYARRASDLVARLERASVAEPERIRIDPNFEYPAYFDEQDIHLQPGNYQGSDLAGFVYHYGSKIFFTGGNDDDRIHRMVADWCPVEGSPARVVDFGCGIGQATTALKQRFPQAEVHGIDIAAPMLRYGHMRALDMGLEVFFSQQNAAKTDFRDGSVDLVLAMILFHELPPDVAEGVVREAQRILCPGGHLMIIDFPHIGRGDLTGRHCVRLFDSWYNGEPFAMDFVYSDFTALLKRFFAEVNPDLRPAATSTGALQIRVCRKVVTGNRDEP